MERFVNASFNDVRSVTDARPSPDGTKILYSVGGVDLEKDRKQCWLWVYDTESGASKQLTFDGAAGAAGWLDDGSIYFQAKRADDPEDGTSFYRLSLTGGEAAKMFDIPVKQVDAEYLGGGRFVICGLYNASAPGEGSNALYDVYDEYPYHADGRGYVNKFRVRLYLYENGSLTPLTDELFQANQLMNFRMKLILSKDKKRLYYCGETVKTLNSPACDMYVCDLETGKSRLLFKNDRYQLVDGFEFGGRVWFYGYRCDAGCGSDFYAEDVVSIGEGETEFRTDLEPDLTIDGLCAGKESMYLFIGNHDHSDIYRWVPGNDPEFVLATQDYIEEGISPFAAGAGDDVYYVGNAPMKVMELTCLHEGETRTVTDLSGPLTAKYAFSENEHLDFKSDEGHTVYGYVMKPYGYEPGKKYPGILMIHGGPESVYLNILDFTMQRYCAEGYFVFFCNPRGSTNYGRKHMDLEQKYGTIDYKDVMDFTDAVLSAYPDIDADRLAVTGGSYGGFMTNWIIGHTDRFKAAAPQRSISNWISMYGCTDIFYFDKWSNGGSPWEKHEKLWEQSPLAYAGNFRTPTLLIQNERDYRCPVEQAEQVLTALIEKGVPCRMILFKNASHSVTTPMQARKKDDEIIAWFDRYAKNPEKV